MAQVFALLSQSICLEWRLWCTNPTAIYNLKTHKGHALRIKFHCDVSVTQSAPKYYRCQLRSRPEDLWKATVFGCQINSAAQIWQKSCVCLLSSTAVINGSLPVLRGGSQQNILHSSLVRFPESSTHMYLEKSHGVLFFEHFDAELNQPCGLVQFAGAFIDLIFEQLLLKGRYRVYMYIQLEHK